MPATGVSGKDFLLQINTGTEISPVMTTVAAGRSHTLNRTAETISVTTKDSNRWAESIPGNREWSIDGDHLYIPTDAGYVQLKAMFDSQLCITVQILRDDGLKERGTALLTDFPLEYPEDDAATTSVSLQGTGPLTTVA